MNHALSEELRDAAEKVQYDTQCKRVLSNKVILAWIMRRVVKEFAGMSVEEIIPCIEGTPEISTVHVNPGRSGTEKISGMANEDKVPGEGAVYYDIRFYALAPARTGRIRLLLNVEAQKSFRPGYEIVTRGIFYGARMISAQLGKEFEHSRYDDIRKVYSVWICMNAPGEIGNAISVYSMKKEDLVSGLPDLPEAYDKLSVVVIALNEKADSEDELIGMMNTLLSLEKTYEEKRSRLEEEYHIGMTSEMGKEWSLMCNLSDLVEERGIQKGIQRGVAEGIEKGIKKGIEKGKRDMVSGLLRLGTVDEKDICKVAGITREELEKIKAESL